ncbi:MAG TPA: phenylacetate--CoA ligase [Peptococcaceae bacterium]|jgi:phenylacetate-CoA ligase|nr:phenylacetate--CoA ligase [Clostridia bacterium]HOB82502.1 phenylacetate--CoA ligase [Peptococcaceae bacterium]HPZ71629.1 phenylacetate--CoA ligase [Peptococcaceae bacterium]HQD54415.1 phenylacetate--CoA ligase [Peptococcaceae bacterium]
MYWNQHRECLPREQLEEMQLARLKKVVERVYYNVPFYRQKFQERGLEPSDIKSLADLKNLPFTTKQDLRDNYPFGMFAAPMSEIVRVHASSGTTGKPTVVGYTRTDLNNWAEIMARSLTSGGTTKDSVIQIAFGYGLFTGGFGVHYGAERIGALVIPISGGNTERQIMIMKDFGTTVLACTPSYAIYLAETLEKMGIDRSELKLKYGIFGAEPWSEKMREEIEKRLNITAIDIYGLSEVIGPGVAIECQEKKGLHIFEDHFIPEIIDPVTGEVLPEGEKGELVFTTLTKEAFPVIRYRTRDLSVLTRKPCPCGRTHIKMAKVFGRTDDMLIIRGVNVFPSQVETAILEVAGVEPHYLLVVDRVGSLDELEIQVEVSPRMFSDQVKGLEDLERKIKHRVESILGISVRIRLVEPNTLPRSEGKACRIFDRRNI